MENKLNIDSNTKELIVGINNYQKLSEYLNGITNKE